MKHAIAMNLDEVRDGAEAHGGDDYFLVFPSVQ